MTSEQPRTVLDRTRAISFDADLSVPPLHARSRALLMREYLRRAALWAQACGARSAWPFFDVAEYFDTSVTLDAEISAELDEFIRLNIGTPSIQRTLRGAVRWSAVRAGVKTELPELPDLYEPLLLMFERGGEFSVEQFIDLQGVAIPQGSLEQNLSATPFLTLAPKTLDALDGKGRVTYFAKVSEGYPRRSPRGIVRRRLVGGEGEEAYDEAFTRNLRWELTEYLRLYELGHNDVDHVEITEIEAAGCIESVTNKLTGAQ